MAKGKRMTVREKEYRAKVKKELQERGLIQPDKPRLNRRKFVEKAETEWMGQQSMTDLLPYLSTAAGLMLDQQDKKGRISLEAVGVAKFLLLVIRLRTFEQNIIKSGRTTYKVKEQFDYIEDILRA